MAENAIYLPALRCYVGDRWFYCSAMTFEQVAHRVVRSDELVSSKALNDLIQRTLTDRSADIVRYIESQSQRFFNSLVLAVFEGDPEWLDIQLLDTTSLPTDLAEEEIDKINSRIGLLRLSGSEKIFALDGQHRVEGIKQALAKDGVFRSEEISILFVSHRAGAEGKERTRRLFTTLNRYARAVSKYEKIALDEDDAVAILTRRLLNEHKYLNGLRTAYSKSAAIPVSDRISLTTLPVVYDSALSLIRKRYIAGEQWSDARIAYPRPSDEQIAELTAIAGSFWNCLGDWDPEFKRAAKAEDTERATINLRSRSGGHIAFRPVIHLALASAVRRWMDRAVSVEQAFQKLAKVPRELTAPAWSRVIWDPVGKKMIASADAKSVAADLILYWSGFPVDKANLTSRYRSLTGHESKALPRV